jgi:hypothetical protein
MYEISVICPRVVGAATHELPISPMVTDELHVALPAEDVTATYNAQSPVSELHH